MATFEDLLRAAFAVPGVWMTRWSAAAERRSPFASKDDLTRLATAVLSRAGQSVQESVLVKVLANYFGLDPAQVSMDAPEASLEQSGPMDVASAVESALVADAIWVQLTEDERAVLPWLEDSLSNAAQELGWSKTRTHNVRSAARTVLARALQLTGHRTPEQMSAADAADVLLHLQERAASEPEVGR